MGLSCSTIHASNRSIISMECKILTAPSPQVPARSGVMGLPPATARDSGGLALRWKTSSVGSQPEALQFHHIRLHGNGLAGLQSQGHMRRPQAALSLLRTGGMEGEGSKGDVSAFAFPQRRSATACIPTTKTEWEVVDLHISVGEDGSWNGELLWAPTTVSASTLSGCTPRASRGIGEAGSR